MSKPRRPEYPRCIMTPAIIQRIRENQEAWDREYGGEEENE